MDSTERKLREQQIESYGRLMAGFSHEMKNHLGIIRESAGLIADLLEINSAQIDPVLAERFHKITETIEKRIVLSAGMYRHLSSFAHRSDTAVSSFVLQELIEDMIAFLERFARLKEVQLEFRPGVEVSLVSSPSLLHHLIYRLFVACLGQLKKGDVLTLASSVMSGGAKISFLSSASLQLDPEFKKDEAAALASLQADLREDAGVVLELKHMV